ncbi:MAG: twin-arginine translocation signal domain-containing protein [Terriglobales bacterium]
MTTRRSFLQKSTQVAAGALAAGAITASTGEAQTQQPQTLKKKLHILMRSSWGTDEPTRASFVFSHGVALAEAGHDVQIFLTHEATYLMRKNTVDMVKPIGWPPLSETMAKVVAKKIPVFS